MPLTSVLTGFVDRLYRYGDTKKDYAEVESEEGADPYRELAARDQILDFFEHDYDDVMGYLPEALRGIATKEVLDRGRSGIEEYMEELRVAYYNAVNGEAFQNKQLEEKKISLEHTKLDLQDRLDKRNLKHQERMSLVPKLTQIIGRAKLAKFLATTGYGTDSVPTLLYIGHRVKETLKYELDFATARETWKYTSKPEAIREPVPERVRDDRKDVQ
ncbi:hypothetical protein Pmar_PMAR016056 [Perkinsus marinus ATCC 50983]|uniref:Uncharacterized protein n=1 Tax=Perkinsus marinus (strain ATCC 50983 / TXsc) TaxID=423536 RepID=C5LYX7_PERM5|nr:hypothetical protein Pmar_PMAR016056 [Perkinsus marinus ATCC 50983]EEQ97986.1 hypothetical protein Pmar_PMAR016056 [Perkinsus marinus ATCC 50983]|eukprot:XP_002765269.1 hypothetical protein Pmar_PMAR016056 [Perkinsus marinus ATCC 50983]